MNKRGISPIIATILLIAFAVAIGAMIMSWTANIVHESPQCSSLPEEYTSSSAFCKISSNVIAPQVATEGGYIGCNDKSIDISQLPLCVS